ncbi:MAG: hypothetical protein AAFU57_10945 [Bacteroidota bacterium]
MNYTRNFSSTNFLLIDEKQTFTFLFSFIEVVIYLQFNFKIFTMKKAKKIGLSLNKKVVSNFQKNTVFGGNGTFGSGCCPNTQVDFSCAPGCAPTTGESATPGCRD